jgi:hypothetical protein
MKKMFLKFALVLALIPLLAACGFNDARNDEAGALIVAYVNAVHAQEYDKALDMVSEEFLMERDGREGWIKYYNEVHDALGPITTLKLKTKLSDARLSAHFHMYQYTNRYEKGLGKELITVMQKINSKDALVINGHKIESSKLKVIRD